MYIQQHQTAILDLTKIEPIGRRREDWEMQVRPECVLDKQGVNHDDAQLMSLT